MALWFVAGLLIVLLLTTKFALRRRSLRAGPSPKALSAGRSDLVHAIDELRDAISMMTPSAARACALLALERVHPVAFPRDVPTAQLRSLRMNVDVVLPMGVDDVGPGTERFEVLLTRLAEQDEEDRRDLADAGVDVQKLVAVLAQPIDSPKRWKLDVLATLEFMHRELQTVRRRRYG